ncbi:MAG: hypothetical protein EPO13_11980 [Actinomycetota bacterium]|nr:MAG: hypothetical protein EPO13_11980 [Actinomycetota bacterium]
MRLFACDTCRSVAFFDDLGCGSCGTPLGYLPSARGLVGLTGDRLRAAVGGTAYFSCANRSWGCNWLVPEDAGSGQCEACRLTRRRPDRDDTVGWEQLARTWQATRRLLFQLHDIGLPVVSHLDRPDGGLAFDLVASTSGAQVMIGHANGVITIDISETSDPHREALRASLQEAYRTMLGHFRHEIGHYYWQVLVWDTGRVEGFRELFGDERADYGQALDVHYRFGAPDGWQDSYFSHYATSHPWEDFAETFAHYLHIHDTLQTAASFGLGTALPPGPWSDDERVRLTSTPQDTMTRLSAAQLLAVGRPLSLAVNHISRSMGQNELYPFRVTPAILAKLEYVRDLVLTAAGER